jgi:hypothetical protein
MSQPAPVAGSGALPTHEIQQRLLKNVEALRELAAANERGDAAAVAALTASVGAELKALAETADKQSQQQKQQQQW